jgi:acetyl-CoA carboxylase biotin carboxylase subunit
MFDKILIANRGEIALRVLRAAKELGIATVAVHSTADANAMHVRLADESVCIGPPPARESYLNIPALIAACEITGADAVHPGYGFLSENARFAEILERHHITFIGPKAEHIRSMGDKIEAKRTAKRLGIPVRAGLRGRRRRRRGGAAHHSRDRLPVIIKAAAGGGGRGMKVARSEDEVSVAARDRPQRSQGRLRRRRGLHREISREAAPYRDPGARRRQGPGVHLGERDCSLQRRHQKVWEEAVAGSQRRRARAGSAISAPRRWPISAISAPARSSSSTRTASSISSR